MQLRKVGNFMCADFFDNTGGLNTADSPWVVQDSQVTGGRNFDYALTGGFRKSKGKTKTNSSPDTQTKTLGVSLFQPSNSTTKTIIRCAGQKIQKANSSFTTFTNLTADTLAASSDLLASGSTIPVVFTQFNTTTSNTLWLAGSGSTSLFGVYDPTSANKVTANGVETPAGSISTGVAGGTSTFVTTGSYYYAVGLYKASTGAVSNAALDKIATIAATTDAVTITLSSITAFDQTKYSQIWIYRSAVGGASAFTTGDIIAKVASSSTTYVDTGTAISTTQNIPRASSTVLDNSVLPAGTYSTLCAYKRRLVTSIGSTIYLSDLNKPESWPATNLITVPSGGPITGLAALSYASPTASSIDEILVIFKEKEIWVLTGSSTSDWALKFIDFVGCPIQSLICTFNGYLAWIDYRGPYIWDGSGKPIYAWRTIGDYFKEEGNVDKSLLNTGWGTYSKNRDQIVWVLSSVAEGAQLFSIKMDTRLTQERVQDSLGGKQVDTVLLTDILSTPLYAGAAVVPTTEEYILAGDSSGYFYKLFDSFDDSGSAIDFQYESKYFDLGSPGVAKRFHKIIVWCSDTSDEDLTLDYWTKYNNGEDEASTQTAKISQQVSSAYYDLAYYDAAYYDLIPLTFNSVVFNLNSPTNSSEGDCIKLRFKQDQANAPLSIAGYSILFTEIGLRK